MEAMRSSFMQEPVVDNGQAEEARTASALCHFRPSPQGGVGLFRRSHSPRLRLVFSGRQPPVGQRRHYIAVAATPPTKGVGTPSSAFALHGHRLAVSGKMKAAA